MDTSLNSQIVDAVQQTTVTVVGQSSAVALGMFYQGSALALSLAAHNATHAQQQGQILAQAVLSTCVASITAL